MQRSIALMLCLAHIGIFLISCASDGVQKRVDQRGGTLERMGENMEIRRQARDERYDRQFDRLMN